MRRLPCLLLLFLFGCGDDDGGGASPDSPTAGDGAGQPDAPIGGPLAQAGPDRQVLGGLVVPLDGSSSQGASFAWTGDGAVTLEDAGALIAWAHVPDVAAGTSFTFTLTATMGADTATDEVTVTVMDAVFENFLSAITDPAELNSSEGIEFIGDAMWVVSNQTAFVSHFDAAGAFVERHVVADNPVGMNLYTDGRLAIANSSLEEVQLLDPASGDVEVLFDQLMEGGAVGTANYPLPDAAGNLFLSTRQTQTIVRFDATAGVAVEWLDLTGIAVNPNAISFGPEPDRLYIGADDRVLRVPILADGSAGAPELYVDGILSEVDGLTFDEGRNLWIGCPGAQVLLVAPYVATGATAVSRSWDAVDADIDRFVNTSFGSGPFGETTLYWTGLNTRFVGRLPVGLRGLDPPLAP